MDGTRRQQWQLIGLAAVGLLGLWGALHLDRLLTGSLPAAAVGGVLLATLLSLGGFAMWIAYRLGGHLPKGAVERGAWGLLNGLYVVLIVTLSRWQNQDWILQGSLLLMVLLPAVSMVLVTLEKSVAAVRMRIALVYLGIVPQIAALQQVHSQFSSQSIFGMPVVWLAFALIWLFAVSMLSSWEFPEVHLRVQKELLPRWIPLALAVALLIAALPVLVLLLQGYSMLEGPAFASYLLAALSCLSIFTAVPRLRKWGSGPPAWLTIGLALVFGSMMLAMHWGWLTLPARYCSTASIQLLLLALAGWLAGLPKQGTQRRTLLSTLHTACIALMFGLLWWALPMAGKLTPTLQVLIFMAFFLGAGLGYSRIELSYRELADSGEDRTQS